MGMERPVLGSNHVFVIGRKEGSLLLAFCNSAALREGFEQEVFWGMGLLDEGLDAEEASESLCLEKALQHLYEEKREVVDELAVQHLLEPKSSVDEFADLRPDDPTIAELNKTVDESVNYVLSNLQGALTECLAALCREAQLRVIVKSAELGAETRNAALDDGFDIILNSHERAIKRRLGLDSPTAEGHKESADPKSEEVMDEADTYLQFGSIDSVDSPIFGWCNLVVRHVEFDG